MERLWLTSQLKGLNFTKDQIDEADLNNEMLLLTVYTSGVCNAKCPSCFITNTDDDFEELKPEDYKDILIQAKELGVKTIKISGAGEPLIVKDTLDILEICEALEMIPVIYTNGSALGDNRLAERTMGMSSFELIRQLDRYHASLVYKFNSSDEKIQDFLLGVEGLSEKTYRGIFNLLYNNFNKDNRLAFQTIITPYNYKELAELYDFARRNHIIPYFETVLRKEKASENTDLYVPDEDIKSIFTLLSQMDKNRYGLDWIPIPSYANFQCTELMYSFVVDNFGYVRICPGIWETAGNLRDMSLREAWNSEKMKAVRDGVKRKLTGKCGSCDLRARNDCAYGCRAYAYINTGNIFGEYNECWWG